MAIFRGTGGQGDSTTDTTVTTVTQKAAEAASSATSAANSATSASNSATSAETSATNAATSESNAANSATASATSATASETAKTAAQAAQTAAETAETNAETAEANAETAQTQAESARDNAQTAQTAAETAETNAETAYADTLAIFGDAQDVQDAVDSASASATTATTKASEAATSATNATNSATSAGTSETNAASSASQAATSAASASSYATDAQTAQTAAETAQAAAEAAEYNINGLYLGSLADDPTLDGNGVAVTTGDLYFNTTEQEVRVYTDGDVWEPIQELSGDQTVNSLTSNNDVVVKGNLEVQGTTITVDSATAQTIDLGDNDRIRLGDTDDLQLYHDGTDSYIANTTGTLKLSGNTDVTGNITVSGTVDGRDIAADGTTLDAVASTYVDVSGDTLTGDLAFGDNVKAKFGDSDDLEIYHDGSGSYITDQGTGNLRISGTNLNLQSAAGEIYLRAINNGAVDIRYDNAIKLETTASGVDITGTVTADGATIDGTLNVTSNSLNLSSTSPVFTITDTDTSVNHKLTGASGFGSLFLQVDAADSGLGGSFFLKRANTNILQTANSTGDISFYDDSGTSEDFYWDASTSRLGLGTTSPEYQLQLGGSSDNTLAFLRSTTDTAQIVIRDDDTIGYFGARNNFIYISPTSGTGADGLVVRTDTGNVGIGTTSPSTALDVTGTVTADGLKIDSGVFDINLEGSLDALPADNDESHIFTTSGLGSGFFAKYGALGLSSRNKETSSSDIGFFTDKLLRLQVADGGYIYFYEDTGITAKLTWDASAEELQFKDGVKAEFGNGGDLVIYHDGSNSRIQDLGTGNLNVQGNNLVLSNTSGNPYFQGVSGGTTALYYAGSSKLTTTSTGIDVTGTVVADDSVLIEGGVAQLILNETDVSQGNSALINSGGQFSIRYRSDDGGTTTRRLAIDNNSGDISFYDDAGTSQDLYWDASTSRLGLGTTSPSTVLEIKSSGNTAETVAQFGNLNIEGGLQIETNGNLEWGFNARNSRSLTFSTNQTEAMRIDSSGNLLVGKTAASSATVGQELKSSGVAIFTQSANPPIITNRLSTDGEIINFRKDGTTVGSIGTAFGNSYFASSLKGIRFRANDMLPVEASDGSAVDAQIDLGISTNRWRNLYLSGGVYLSGTGSANLLDDYEEGTSNVDATQLTINYSYSSKVGKYTKIGDTVIYTFRYEWTTTNKGSGDTVFNNLPFVASADGYVHLTECNANISADQIYGEVISGTNDFKIYGRNNASTTLVGPVQKGAWTTGGFANVIAGVAIYKT